MAFTAEQKREWRKRPEVKQRQAELQASFYKRLAHKHDLSVKAIRLLTQHGLRANELSACDSIRRYEIKHIERRARQAARPTTGPRVSHPRQQKPCPVCGVLTHFVSCHGCKYKYQRMAGIRKENPETRNARERRRYATNEMVRFNKNLSVAVRRNPQGWAWGVARLFVR